MQVITGVDWFYRQFGYEMGVKLWGNRLLDAIRIPELEEGKTEGYRLRAAHANDYSFIREVYDRMLAANFIQQSAHQRSGRLSSMVAPKGTPGAVSS